jgi:hypothetical protein
MQLDFLGELALRAGAVAVADELGIDRTTADVAVMGLELFVQVGERYRHKHVHAAQQMVLEIRSSSRNS